MPIIGEGVLVMKSETKSIKQIEREERLEESRLFFEHQKEMAILKHALENGISIKQVKEKLVD